MKRILFLAGLFSLILLAGCDGMEEKKDYLVSVKEDFTEEELEALNIDEADIKHKFSFMDMYLISLNESQVEKLEGHEKVNYVEADQEVSTPEPGDEEK
ncbi:protease inhibitor I9 family protein [Salinicoccus halodurans]|uniref:Peptidase inhibitor I9 n=1 Tax=Salinicoccus halodurans TaxID=407035 RepID=A0A0F7HKT5_9STAP|nr:protease inhibitor I9 family protein [Salinicoccus halodurans]AKG74558.1 hypothetical protein AAT16_10370 [Salinicoccus halodurans]SFK89789.1 Peptidase inhibitor I9 [Salinicoccus halodurans]